MSPDHPALAIPGLENPEVIGQGGYGTVFAVDEPEFGRKVAVKVIQHRLDGDSVRRAFVRECQAMGSLSGHPHIVTVHRGGTTERGEPYIVMDLMTAGSLADRLAREGPLPWAEVLEIGVTVAGGLETAHRAGILHLDLKPANLLVSRYGEPKLGDFGISRLAGGAETASVGVRASAAYAAPERILDGTATPAADLYGLGATLFALLTGRPAFATESGEDLLVMVARVVRDPVPDLRHRGVPDPVARIVERLMAKSPADRFASAADAATALQAAQRATGRPVTRAVIEGALPDHGETRVWPAPPSGPLVAAGPMRGAYGPPAGLAGPTAPATVLAPMPVRAPVEPVRPRPPPLQPPRPAAGPRPRRRPLLLAGVAAVLVVALGAGAAALVLTRPTEGIGRGAVPSETETPITSTPAAPTTEEVVIPPDDVVAVASGVTHPATVDARAVLRGYVTGINEARYADAFAYFSSESDSYKGGLEAWQLGQSTTYIESPEIVAVRDTGPDTIDVDITFTSSQATEFGPDGQTCTNWELAVDMVGPGPGWLIRKAIAINPPAAC